MSSLNHEDDLHLLLSLQDRVLETPPASPSHSPDHGMPKKMGQVDMSVFRDAVQDFMDYEPKNVKVSMKGNLEKSSNDIEVDKFSGLRIRDQLVSRAELSNHLSDIRFVRLPAIKNLLRGDTLSGCWATVGILIEKGMLRTSSIGKSFTIWKIGCLDENNISLFLFGDAYEKNYHENVGTVFALFNCSLRNANSGNGFSLSVFSTKHILKLGVSADIGFCKGNGTDCKAAINIRKAKYCKYHIQSASKKYVNSRTELNGGNLRTAFRDDLKSEGIYVAKPMGNGTSFKKSVQPMKLLSVEGLKRALSNADKVTTNVYSQGIRFLNQVAGKKDPKETMTACLPKRGKDIRVKSSTEHTAKKMKITQTQGDVQQKKHIGIKMIELDFTSSDED